MEKIPESVDGGVVAESSRSDIPEAEQTDFSDGPVTPEEAQEAVDELGIEGNEEARDGESKEDWENRTDATAEAEVEKQAAQDKENLERVRAELEASHEDDVEDRGGSLEEEDRPEGFRHTLSVSATMMGGMEMGRGGTSNEKEVKLKACEKCKGGGRFLFIFKCGVCGGTGRVPTSIRVKETHH